MAKIITSKGKLGLTTEQEALKRAPISTPMGAQQLGQNPDEAKMYGTPAQVESKLEKIQEQPAVPQVTQPTQKQKTAEELEGLSGIQSQVQALANQRIANLQPVTPTLAVADDVLKTYPTGTKEILDAYTAAPNAESKAKAVANLSNLLGRELTTQELSTFFQSAPEAVAEKAQVAPIKIGDLGLGAAVDPAVLGLTQEQFDNLSVDEFKQKMSDLQTQQFKSTENLQVQLANAVGQQREELQGKLKQSGSAGDIGVEQKVSTLMDRVEQGDEIEFGGERMKLSDLLKEDGLSDVVLTAFQQPDFMKKLQETEPAFAEWMNNNKEALENVFDELGTAGANVQQAAEKRKALLTSTPLSIVEALYGNRLPEHMTLGDMTEIENQLGANPIWSAMAESPLLKDRVLKDKKLIGSLSGMDANQINNIVAATTAIEKDPAMIDILGYEPGGLLTEAQAQRYNTLAPAIKGLPSFIKSEPSFQKFVQNDQLSLDDIAIIQQTPRLWDRVLENENMKEEYELNKNDVEDLMGMYFGGTTTLESVNKGLARLKAYADSGDLDALKKYEYISKNFAGDNGVVGPEDLQLVQAFAALPDQQSVSDVVKNGPTFNDVLKQSKSNLQTGLSFESEDESRRMVIPYLLGDSKMQDAEMNDLLSNTSEAQFVKMMKTPWFQATVENPEFWGDRVLQIEATPMTEKFKNETLYDTAGKLSSIPIFKTFKVNPTTGAIVYSLDPQFNNPTTRADAQAPLKEYTDYIESQMLETTNPHYKTQLKKFLEEANKIKEAIGLPTPKKIVDKAEFQENLKKPGGASGASAAAKPTAKASVSGTVNKLKQAGVKVSEYK